MYFQSVTFHIQQNKNVNTNLEFLQLTPTTPKIPNETWYFRSMLLEKGYHELTLTKDIKESISKNIKRGRLKLAKQIYKSFPDIKSPYHIIKSLDVDFKNPENVFISLEKPISILIKNSENSFSVVTSNENDCKLVINAIYDKFKELSETTKNLDID